MCLILETEQKIGRWTSPSIAIRTQWGVKLIIIPLRPKLGLEVRRKESPIIKVGIGFKEFSCSNISSF